MESSIKQAMVLDPKGFKSWQLSSQFLECRCPGPIAYDKSTNLDILQSLSNREKKLNYLIFSNFKVS